MKSLRLIVFLLLSADLIGQSKFEVQEFTGLVKSISPGMRFAAEYLELDVQGESEIFAFHPHYGVYITDRIKLGDKISVRVNIHPRTKSMRKEMNEQSRLIKYLFFNDRIAEMKINNEWVALPEIVIEKEAPTQKIVLDRKVVGDYIYRGVRIGLQFDNGFWACSPLPYEQFNTIKSVQPGDVVSFSGWKMGTSDGYKYHTSGIKEVYYFNPLTKETGRVFSYLYKQNSVCIGVKFKTDAGKELSVSFPSDDAKRVKEFLRPEKKVTVYYHNFKVEGQLHPPELQALIQGTDTLYINSFGFYGGADVKHDHKDITIEGKITKINSSDKGNLRSIIVASEYYIEIDAMMAQQLGFFFQKGKVVSIQGKERIRKEGEIYQKDYRIVVPEKVVVDGKTFSLFQP
jgi:hypothetical protein